MRLSPIGNTGNLSFVSSVGAFTALVEVDSRLIDGMVVSDPSSCISASSMFVLVDFELLPRGLALA